MLVAGAVLRARPELGGAEGWSCAPGSAGGVSQRHQPIAIEPLDCSTFLGALPAPIVLTHLL